MLSSASYVCLGVYAGIWIISRGIYLDVLVLSFIPVLLFQCVCMFCLLLFFRCFQFYYVVGSSGCGSPGIQCLTIPCKFSSRYCVG